MNKKSIHIILLAVVFLLSPFSLSAQEHPLLLINSMQLEEMKEAVHDYPGCANTVFSFMQKTDEFLAEEISVPIPKDPAGGYTHSQHKLNGKALKQAGIAFLLSDDDKYASYTKDLFLKYAELYPNLGIHPVKKSYAPGKLFWQQLNEAVWLVDAIQAYDAIYNYLSKKERKKIEKDLLLPYAAFLSVENPEVFNRIHNHGVWAAAAVGMTGIVTGNEVLFQSALFGINEEGKPNRTSCSIDNLDELSAGFLVQTLRLFSPDGYYTEGPYYQRYAMTPFLLFAQSIDNNYPDLNFMDFGDSIYIKAVETLIDLTDARGRYYPINDNLKGMSLYSPESLSSLAFLYAKTKNSALLDLLDEVKFTNIDVNIMKVLEDLHEVKIDPLIRTSRLISDGPMGKQGGLALLRDTEDEFCSVLKYASHGLSHGHFDRLNLYYYNLDNEVLCNYGAARFVNIKAKEGGRYLDENTSYAKQTIAHNSLVVNEESHFKGIYEEAQKTHSDLVFASMENPNEQFVCATENAAYEGVQMTRISGLFNDKDFINPLLIDILMVTAESQNKTYDLPYHFDGEILNIDFTYKAFTNKLEALGTDFGYQHLWRIAEGESNTGSMRISWLDDNKIHTLSATVNDDAKILLVRTGANDPDFNLRTEPAIILRENNKKDHLFAAVLEVHGDRNESTEMVSNQEPLIQNIQTLHYDSMYVAVEFMTRMNTYIFLSVHKKGQKEKEHILNIEGKEYRWTGNYTLIKQSNNEKIKR